METFYCKFHSFLGSNNDANNCPDCVEINKNKCCCYCGKEKDDCEKIYTFDNGYLSCREWFIQHDPR